MFELPGVKKNDLKIELSRCQNGVKQVSITGESRQPLPDGLIALKERKYGKFRRVIPVRHDTKASRLNFPYDFAAQARIFFRRKMSPSL
jgi:HSP20 family molecular chaperone IbpA